MNYLQWHSRTITDFSDKNISDLYYDGYLFTRIGHGVMHQTRSVRIDLSKFDLSSENRRILKKVEGVDFRTTKLPLADYDFSIGKLAKDFYETKFGPGIMSAQKIKEMLTDNTKSNFNNLLQFHPKKSDQKNDDLSPLGYTICYKNPDIIHYSYPFYKLDSSPKDMGLGMMTMTIEWAKKAGLKYIYLGSLQRSGDIYKLQFKGLEWFDGHIWSNDTAKVREILTKTRTYPQIT